MNNIAVIDNKSLLSICIPTYNREVLLKGLIENILEEIENFKCHKDVQVVIVDGCSTDNTIQIVEEFSPRMNIKYFRRDNKEGIDKDILKCIEIASGEFCWLFSDDDRFMPGAINNVLNVLKKNTEITGCFCNRISYDSKMKKKVHETKSWPSEHFHEDKILTDKSECFKYLGMDLGFISSQIVNRAAWKNITIKENLDILCDTCYLMFHIIAKIMNDKFNWYYISTPLLKQRTGNDSFLKSKGVMNRQLIEHENFSKLVLLHYDKKSKEYYLFFKKMVNRLPRVIANLKSQKLDYVIQLKLITLLFKKYYYYPCFWLKTVPIFLLPNFLFIFIKKLYFNYIIK
jgi:abequosyltransferase